MCAPIWCCPWHQEIVLGRLRGRIRRLFGVGAGIRVETRGNGGAIQFCWVDVHVKNFPITKVHAIPSPTGTLPLSNKQMDAISPRRRRIPSGAARERSSHVLDGTNLVSTRTCTNSTHIPFFIKVFARLFSKSRVPSSPQSHSKKYAFAFAICSSNLAALAESFETMSSVPLTIPPLTISRTLMLEKLR